MDEEETIETLREAMDGLFGIVQSQSIILARILATLKHVGIDVGIDLLSDTTRH